jgi:16S rRNA (uracil1498-N3)-methyltransferase
MNLLILEAGEVGQVIPRGDRRYEHVKKILKKVPGDKVAAGLADGAIGTALVRELDASGLVLDFEAFEGPAGVPPELAQLRLVLGFPRPIQATRLLKELTTLGLREIRITGTELGEKSYAQSTVFKDGDFRRSLIEGAEQSGNPRLPLVSTYWSVRRCLDALPPDAGTRLLLHPYAQADRLGAVAFERGAALKLPVTLAVGSERGWTDAELAAFEAAGFASASMGSRILKTETAAIAASVVCLAALGLL